MIKQGLLIALGLLLIMPFVIAENNGTNSITANSTVCSSPVCEGIYNTGNVDSSGCAIYACPKNPINSSTNDSNSCLDNPDNYYDQETGKCYSGFSKEIIAKTCLDSDGGINKYLQAHTYGFRSVFADSRDQRIRTGGKDACLSNNQLVEHYCDDSGYIQTTYLECPNGCQNGACIKGKDITETVTCNFKGTSAGNECYLAGEFGPEDQGTKWCKGTESCTIKFNGEEGDKITWKSSCGGYQYTTQDGNDETITFDCSIGETNTSQVANNAFSKAYWQCYDGKESYEGGDSSCKPSGLWKKYALSFCENHCSSETKKCGVNSFSLSNSCYSDVTEIESSTASTPINAGPEPFPVIGSTNEQSLAECKTNSDCPSRYECINSICQIEMQQAQKNLTSSILICKDSCSLDNKCYPFGYRKADKYCSDSGAFVTQLASDAKCDNSFECGSNVCVSGQCISQGLMDKILNWFKKLFG